MTWILNFFPLLKTVYYWRAFHSGRREKKSFLSFTLTGEPKASFLSSPHQIYGWMIIKRTYTHRHTYRANWALVYLSSSLAFCHLWWCLGVGVCWPQNQRPPPKTLRPPHQTSSPLLNLNVKALCANLIKWVKDFCVSRFLDLNFCASGLFIKIPPIHLKPQSV